MEKFNVIVAKDPHKVKLAGIILGQNHIRTLDLREADIVQKDDESKIGEVYVIQCEGNIIDYERLKQNYFNDEMFYEGLKTLY